MTLQLPDFQCCKNTKKKLTNMHGYCVDDCMVCDGLKILKTNGCIWPNDIVVFNDDNNNYIHINNKRILIDFNNNKSIEFHKNSYWWTVYVYKYYINSGINCINAIMFCLDGHNINLKNNLYCVECKLKYINLLQNITSIPIPLIYKIVEYNNAHYDKLVQEEFDYCLIKK